MYLEQCRKRGINAYIKKERSPINDPGFILRNEEEREN